MASEMVKLFVYGSLKKGEFNHSFMQKCGCRFISKATTKEEYPLCVATRFNIPFLLNHKGIGKRVHGEVYEMDPKHLIDTDAFEAAPIVYVRERIIVTTDETPSNTIECYTYLLPTSLTPYPDLTSLTPEYDLIFISDYSHVSQAAKYVPIEDRLKDYSPTNGWKYIENNLSN